jgi:membrane protease YdiL (CAAX protease family)
MHVTAQQQLSLSQDSPIMGFMLLAGAIWLSKLWWQDYQKIKEGEEVPGALPGTSPTSLTVIWIAIIVGCLLVLLETFAEYQTGTHLSQSTIAAWYLAPMIAAAVIEELIFRGYLSIQNKGRAMLIFSCVLFSMLFALAHPHLWSWEDNQLQLHHDSQKAWVTTVALFTKSLWLYAVRFGKFNPNASLLPCVVAHLTINLLTFLIKAKQGYVQW